MSDVDVGSTDVDPAFLEGVEEPAPTKVGGVIVKFHMHPVLNQLKSWGGITYKKDGTEETVEGAGRPVYDDVEFIEIRVPGDKTLRVDRPVRAHDKKNYQDQYRAWKSGAKDQDSTGTPLSVWRGIPPSMVEELRHFGIRTVEHLANVSDGNLAQIGPIRALRNKAQEFLEASKGNASNDAIRAQLEAKSNEAEAMKRQLKELQEQMSQLQKQNQKQSK